MKIIDTSLRQEKTMDFFHCGPVVGHNEPTTAHKLPQIVRDRVLSIWSRGALFFADPRVDDRSITRNVGKWWGFRDAFEYQQCE